MFKGLFSPRHTETEWMLVPRRYAKGSKENYTGKILLPQQCIADLVTKQIETPYIFRIAAHDGITHTHAGVLEFTAERGTVVLPEWMHEQLAADTSPLHITLAKLPKGKSICLVPQSKAFLDIENPKQSMESTLTHYQVLSKGDTISLYFDDEFTSMLFTVAEIQPEGDGISIIDTDLAVDFLPPADYTESKVEDGDSLLVETVNGIYIKNIYSKDGKGSSAERRGLGVVFASK